VEHAATIADADAEKMSGPESPPVWSTIVREKIARARAAIRNNRNGVRIRFDDAVFEKAHEIRLEKGA